MREMFQAGNATEADLQKLWLSRAESKKERWEAGPVRPPLRAGAKTRPEQPQGHGQPASCEPSEALAGLANRISRPWFGPGGQSFDRPESVRCEWSEPAESIGPVFDSGPE
jgi:hypothetical protein